MFVCPTCHEKPGWCDNAFIEGLMLSRGKCEVCGEVANCLDCHGYKYVQPKKPVKVEWPEPDMEKALTEDSRIDPNPGGEDYPWPTGEPPISQGNDYVTCGAFLSMLHPIRVKTRNAMCTALIPVADLPGPCPACGQWRSA